MIDFFLLIDLLSIRSHSFFLFENNQLTRTFLYNNSFFPANCTFAIIVSFSFSFEISLLIQIIGEAVADI